MTMPGRLLDFFSLEASEYLTRLESLAAKNGMETSDATQFTAAARGLRGSATMAKAGGIVQVAMTVERIGSGVVHGATKWEPELQRALVGAVEDLKLLVRSVRTWGADQDARVEESLRRLARFAPPRKERTEDVIVPISQLFFNDGGQHIIYVAPNPKTNYEQQLREQTSGIGPGTLSPEVKRPSWNLRDRGRSNANVGANVSQQRYTGYRADDSRKVAATGRIRRPLRP